VLRVLIHPISGISARDRPTKDILTIRADRDRYYYGVNELFHLQPNIVEHILHEAPGCLRQKLEVFGPQL
jgi:hypothetical protein